MSPKRFCLTWFGLVMPLFWSLIKSSIVRPKKLVKMSKTTKLKNSYLNILRQISKVIVKRISRRFFWCDHTMIGPGWQPKHYQTKPILFRYIYRYFWLTINNCARENLSDYSFWYTTPLMTGNENHIHCKCNFLFFNFQQVGVVRGEV